MLAAVLLAGCTLPTRESLALRGPVYQPANIYREPGGLPAGFKRVALLPLTLSDSNPAMEAGGVTMDQALRLELQKTHAFELVPVSPGQLRQLTGKAAWKPSDRLPANFFEKLRATTSCDGVLFSHLTRYHPYPPQVVGWRLQLVDATTVRILWSADETFDASQDTVARGAQRYQMEHPAEAAPAASAATVLTSPTRFGQYATATLLGTLPGR